MFDKEKRGYINTQQIGQVLRTMGQSFEERELKQIIKEFDADGILLAKYELKLFQSDLYNTGSGQIEFEEFAALGARFVIQEDDRFRIEEELREAFRLYDKQVWYCSESYFTVPLDSILYRIVA